MRGYDNRDDYRPVRQPSLAGGVNDSHNQTLIDASETPDSLNVDYNRESVQSHGGAIKFNNQVAPGGSVETTCDPALSPLMAFPTPIGGAGNGLTGTVDVPLRGYVYLPYCADTDMGGRFVSEGTPFINENFHIRRGISFERNITFELPETEKLYESPTNGSAAPDVIGTFNPDNGFDEALDECICIVQKGGDRLAPMSWALAIVNIGNGAGLSSLPSPRVSNYALCFMWYDAPQWGEFAPSTMKYNLTTGQHPTSGGASQFSTQAYRAVLIHKYIEPGRRYSVAVQLKMDTGTPGTTAGGGTNTAWNADGYFKVWVSEHLGSVTSYTYVDTASPATSGLEVVRGPTDSLSYLCRYGIRFAGKDAEFLGLGMRFQPWMKCGFIPFGMDCAPLKSGGFSMVDRSANTVSDLYGAATYTLTTAHTSGNAYVTLNQQYVSTGDSNFGADPKGWITSGTLYSPWGGLNISAGANVNSLRGYRFVAPGNFVADGKGAIFTILDYFESGGTFRLNILNGATGAKYPTWVATATLIQCFRWHQRPLRVCHDRIWGTPRDYATTDTILASRRKLSLRSSLRLDDKTEPDIENLKRYHPCDDAEGAVVREVVVGGFRNGFFCPFGNATTDGGAKGKNLVFLSGEGEALTRDLSDDPIFQREVRKMLNGSSQGFGLELTMVMTEAFYSVMYAEALPDPPSGSPTGYRPRGVPDLLCWDIKDATSSGMRAVPRPLLTLSFRNLLASADPKPFTRPAGFSVAVAHRSDQENLDMIVPSDLLPSYRDSALDTHFRYDTSAPWVGRSITIQIGVQSTGSPDTYDVYIAMTPKDAFLPVMGDPADAEFAYWTDGVVGGLGTPYEVNSYYTAAHLTIRRKDLARSVLTVGGRWNCRGKPGDTANLGYGELNARMLVDEVRWFITSPSGALPAASGGLTARNGKLEGTNALPQRLLTSDDILRPFGTNLDAVNVTQGSVSVFPPSQTALFTAEPRASLDAIKGCYMRVTGDEIDVKRIETFGLMVNEWYFISSVAAGGVNAALGTTYEDPTRNCAVGGVFRLAGYCAFEDDVRDKLLTLGRGKSYGATSMTVADVVLTDQFWDDLTVPGGGWRLRIYSPLGRSSAAEILPKWSRGLVTERRGPDQGILGAHGFNTRVYCGVQGALYEADDRWLEEGPNDDITTSLNFRSRFVGSGVTTGLHDDMVIFGSATAARLVYNASQGSTNFRLDDGKAIVIDVRARADSINEFQTIVWLGDPDTDPSLNPSSTGHRFNYAVRLNRGRPELVFGSTNAYVGTTPPEKGLFTATMQQAVAPGEWFHARFYLLTRLSATVLLKPFGKLNGKSCAVSVNATDVGVAGANDWLLTAGLVSPDTNGRILLGIGRDSYKAPNPDLAFDSSTIVGTIVQPRRITGYLHSLNGALAEIVIIQQPLWTGASTYTTPPDFDPNQIDYVASGTTALMRVLGPGVLPIGHKVLDEVAGTYGVIRSHPFVSVFHRFGRATNPISWAEFGSQLYATNGGKPAVIIDNVGYEAGVPAPSEPPAFVLERFPLWDKNARSGFTNDANDPISQNAAGSSKQVYHLQSVGNTYLKQTLTSTDITAMSWTQDKYFHFKAYVRPHSVAGRQQLWRRGTSSKTGGPFLDIIDGRIRFGWFDVDAKEEMYVESTGELLRPNDVHYIYVRCRWPNNDAAEGNWESSYYTAGKIRRIVLDATSGFIQGENIVRRVPPASSSNTTFTATTGHDNNAWNLSTASVTHYAFTSDGYRGDITVVTDATDTITVTDWRKNGVAGTPANGSVIYIGDVSGYVIKSSGANVEFVRSSNFSTAAAEIGNSASVVSPTSGTTGTTLSAGGTSVRPMHNVLSVKRFRRFGEGLSAMQVNVGAFRSLISLTTDALTPLNSARGTGMVSAPGERYTGGATGAVLSENSLFHEDMVGMWWEWGSGSFSGKRYRIISFTSATQINTKDEELNTAIDFSSITSSIEGGVFAGVALRRSTDFNASRTPDNFTGQTTSVAVEFMGASSQGSLTSDYTPFDGEIYSPGWGVTAGAASGTDARCFENLDSSIGGLAGTDPISIGTDDFAAENYNAAGEPGALHFDDNKQFWCTDGRNYGAAFGGNSSQPTTTLVVEGDPHAPSTAPLNTATANADPVWTYLQSPSTWSGQRQVAVAFFDGIQNIPGDAGPQLTVKPAAEDATNPAGAVRLRITNLPITSRATQLWIYESVSDGSVGALFRVLVVDMGTAEATLQFTDAETAQAGSQVLEFTNAEPPRCEIVTTSGSRMVYGALEIQPDACIAAKVGFPGQVDFSKVFRLNSGFGEKVSGLYDQDGQLVAFKRRACNAITFDNLNNAIVLPIGSGTGCVGHTAMAGKEGVLFFLSDKGWQALERRGVTNLGYPTWIGEKLNNYVSDKVDSRAASRIVAALNQRRKQVVMALRLIGEKHTFARMSLELAGKDGVRFGLYERPNVTALASVAAKSGGADRLIGGTEEGFMVWLDDPRTNMVMLGPTRELWGAPVVAAASAEENGITVIDSTALDNALEGWRGVIARWIDADDVIREAIVLGNEGNIVHFADPVLPTIATHTQLTLGAHQLHWETGWLDMGNPERFKSLYFVDFVFDRRPSGTVRVTLYADFDQDKVVFNDTQDLTESVHRLAVTGVDFFWIKAALTVDVDSYETSFDLASIVWRVDDKDQD